MRPEEPIPAWAFRFLQSIPSVTMILSGMSDLEQVKANIATFQMGVPLSSREMDRLLAQAQRMVSKTALPCTACHYCVSHCPQGLDIPSCWRCTTSMPSPAAASWPPWPSLLCRRTSGPAPASAAAAARRSVLSN